MKNNFAAGLITSFIAGLCVVLIDKLLIPKDEDIVLGNFGLVSLSVSFGVFFLIFFVALKEHDKGILNGLTPKPILISSFAVLAFFAYQIFPSYYYREIANGVIDEFIEVENNKKESGLRFINQTLMERVNPISESSAQTIMLTKSVMEERSFLTLLAGLHPDATTSPMLVKMFVFFGISTDYRDDGIYIENGYAENIHILSNLKYNSGQEISKKFIAIEDVRSLVKEKYQEKEYLGGIVCPVAEDYLLISNEDGCAPITNTNLLKFIAKPKPELWAVVNRDNYKVMLSPEEFRHKKSLMTGIMAIVLERTNIKAKVTKQTFLLNFSYVNNKLILKAITSFKVQGDENWLEVDSDYVLTPSSVNNEYTDGYYYMTYNEVSDQALERLLNGRKVSLRYKKDDSEKYEEHEFSLEYFKPAYLAFSNSNI